MEYRSKLLRSLVEAANGPVVLETFYSVPGENPTGLLQVLGISDQYVSDKARETLDAIEEVVESDPSSWHRFLWRVAAFSRVHEVFDARVTSDEDPLDLFEQYYFYFESRMLLAESILSGLNGLYAASDALHRPFLEFSLLQCYYRRVCAVRLRCWCRLFRIHDI